MVQISQSTIQLIQVGANVVLAIFTVVLAWATWQYKKQSEAQTEEMQKTREAEFQPVLTASITHNFVGSHYWFEIENIGKGIAQNVHAEWYVEGMKSEERTWQIPVFHPEELHKFELPMDYNRVDRSKTSGTFKKGTESSIKLALDEEDADLIVDISCKDALGKEYSPEPQSLPILEGMEQRMDAGEFQTRSVD